MSNKNQIIKYEPSFIDESINPLPVPSAWVGLEKIIRSIVKDFNIDSRTAVEFGVDFGYSLSVFSQIFKKTVGIDHFEGDHDTGHSIDYKKVLSDMSKWPNCKIIKSSYQDFFNKNKKIKYKWDLCHIDIRHTYEDTFACGKSALQRCDCVIFHDTESFQEVKKHARI